MSVLEIAAAIGIVAFVIGRQLRGEPLRGKRLLLLPAVLVVIGGASLRSAGRPPTSADLACLVTGGLIAAAIGAAQGSMMRLETRGGGLWGRLPVRSLWLWLALVTSRVAMTVIADGLHARLAASTACVLLLLGINRLGQGAVVTARALAAGVPFAPEKDGTVFLAGRLEQFATGPGPTLAPTPTPAPTPAPAAAPDRRAGRELRHSRRPR
jgi:hypothetical protein